MPEGLTAVASRGPMVGAPRLARPGAGARPAASTSGVTTPRNLWGRPYRFRVGPTTRYRCSGSTQEHDFLGAVAALIRAPQRSAIRHDAPNGHDREAQAVRAEAFASFSRRRRGIL
jgi:hypothetical protein